MRRGRILAAAALASLAMACAGPVAVGGRFEGPTVARDDLGAQRRAVERALAGVERQHTDALAAFEPRADSEASEAELERLLARRHAARAQALEPLAAHGNAEAMYRLGSDLRDSPAPRDVRRWLELTSSAANRGHPLAHDELARWWWHQRGDGSLAAVQRHRARALDHAEAAAQGGDWAGVNRVAVYIAGDVHQYPANLPLAREVMRLCARAGSRDCQARLALRSSYAFAADEAESRLWQAVLSSHSGGAAAWRPATWSELRPAWRRLRAEILAHGRSSAGVYGPCTTSTPWCRGAVTGLE